MNEYTHKSELDRFVWKLITCLCGIGILSLFFINNNAYSEPNNSLVLLQPLIDQAQEGEVIILPPGTYRGPVTINKSITIKGNLETKLINKEVAPAISVNADNVFLKGFNVEQKSVDELGAIQVSGSKVTITDLNIQTKGYGIILRKALDVIIQNNKVVWIGTETISIAQKGNGIDLYASQNISITNNLISGMRDGIYLENSWDTEVINNTITRSRYAIHCMYLLRTKVINNIGELNITGAMIMGVREATVSNNSFRMQNNNVHSQGISMYDVQDSIIINNALEGNRVGLYIQESSQNEIILNDVVRNYIGVQLLAAERNEIHSNHFVSNVIEAQAVESQYNIIKNNYWDSFQGLDLNRDGASEMAYTINPFYQDLVRRRAPFQLFFKSPGMMFLSELHTEGRADWTTDISPLMKLDSDSNMMERKSTSHRIVPWLGALLMLVSACSMIHLGGKQK
ncbi:right-handed parallel beta-helix repeat-containing protein [Paenibacillus sp. FSL K6-2862]|uniref:right-handed parallel beta-helix repeat-containing protein n=1 Tax=Paenibacillus sp. FSL K6-2862 TaxID=2921484 RepID=UPI0030F4E932